MIRQTAGTRSLKNTFCAGVSGAKHTLVPYNAQLSVHCDGFELCHANLVCEREVDQADRTTPARLRSEEHEHHLRHEDEDANTAVRLLCHAVKHDHVQQAEDQLPNREHTEEVMSN